MLFRSQWKKLLDPIWSRIIRKNGVCECCGKTPKKGGLDAHHLIGRRKLKHRWDLEYGLPLCTNCHLYSVDCSAHGSTCATKEFVEWFKVAKPEQYNQMILNKQTMDRERIQPFRQADYEAWHEYLIENDTPVF